MAKQNINSKKGFTIIEVVLVLAIAGLIFIMVFIALPALQRSQRDTARRNDLSRVDTSLTQYQTNNQNTGHGDLPYSDNGNTYTPDQNGTITCGQNDIACSFVQRYMNSGTDSTTNTFKDPDGTYYSVNIQSAERWGNNETRDVVPAGNMNHTVYIVTAAKCNGERAQRDTARHYAVLYRLEGAGVYCIDDQ